MPHVFQPSQNQNETTFQKHDYFLSSAAITRECNRIRMIYQTDSFMCVCVYVVCVFKISIINLLACKFK